MTLCSNLHVIHFVMYSMYVGGLTRALVASTGAGGHVGGLRLLTPHVQDIRGVHRGLRGRLEAGPALGSTLLSTVSLSPQFSPFSLSHGCIHLCYHETLS